MKLRAKFVAYMLGIASAPLILAMSIALWQSSNQTRALTIDIVQGYLDAGANNLSGFFSERKAEINAYAQTPLLKSMDFGSIRPFLIAELASHNGIYEKFIFGNQDGSFYNTAGGNPARGGLRTFDDTDPNAKPRTLTRRDYWKETVGNNDDRRQQVYVSDPMISYTTGAKQIVVAASTVSEVNGTVGMIGGALPWSSFEKKIHETFDHIFQHRNWDSKFFLVTGNGTYWYHWDPSYVVHLKKDQQGQPLLNDIGEKLTTARKITSEPTTELADAGREMIAGKRGYTLFTERQTEEQFYLMYAPVESAGYSVGLVVPKKQMMAPVTSLQSQFAAILGLALLAVILGSWLLSKRVTQPVTSLNRMAKAISVGENMANLLPEGNDEVAQLTDSFNTMVNSLAMREQSLKESEEQFSLAMQGANDGLWDWKIANNQLYFSPRWKSMLGYAETELENTLETWQELIDPDDLERITPTLDDFICGRQDRYEVEYRMRHKDGHYVDILSRAFAVRDQSNRALRMVGTPGDISERRQTEVKIKEINEKLEERVQQRTLELEQASQKQLESEIKHRTILESVVDALITIDEKGNIESANPATQTMFGYTNDEIVGQNVSILMPEPYRHEHDSYLKQYSETGIARILGTGRELEARRSDGSVFPIDLSVSEMTIGGTKKFTGMIKDISKRKNAERNLRKESETLTRLNEITADPATTFEQKIRQLLELGSSTFSLPLGIVSHISNGTYTIEYVFGPEDAPVPGTTFDFKDTYCAHTYAANGAKAFANAGRSEINSHPCYHKFGLESYIGAPIIVDGRRYGTLNFSSPLSRSAPFTANELSLIQLLAQWVGNEMSRSRAERVLSRFKTTLDKTLDCVFMFEPGSLRFFYVNQGALDQIGYSKEELMNMTPLDIKPEISEPEFRQMIEPIISGSQPSLNFETVHEHKNGSTIPVDIFLQYINPQGESPRFVAIVRDVSDRHETTRKLNATIDEMAQRTREISSLSELGDLLHSCHDVDEAYDVVARFIPMLLPDLQGTLYIIDDTGTGLQSVRSWGSQTAHTTKFPPEDCVAIRRGRAYTARADESVLFCRHLPEQKPEISYCMPLAAQGETFGMLHLETAYNAGARSAEPTSITTSLKPDFVETVAKQVSMALASLRSKEELRNQTVRDPLTGLFNRRYMEESFDQVLHSAAISESPTVSFMMIDIDYFKKINDTFGHDAGDTVLRELGHILTSMSRKDDIACRFGGEEFVLCLPGASRKIAFKRATEIRDAVKQLDLHYESRNIGTITVSIGISVYPDLGETPAELMKMADQALYLAKKNGRDRIVLAERKHNPARPEPGKATVTVVN